MYFDVTGFRAANELFLVVDTLGAINYKNHPADLVTALVMVTERTVFCITARERTSFCSILSSDIKRSFSLPVIFQFSLSTILTSIINVTSNRFDNNMK